MQKRIFIRVLIALFAILGIFATTKFIDNSKTNEIVQKCDRTLERQFKLSAYDTIGYGDDDNANLVYQYEFSATDICTLGEAIDYVNAIVSPKPFGLGNKTTYGRPLTRIMNFEADYTVGDKMYWNSSSTTHAACIGQRPVGSFPGSPNTCQLGIDNLVFNNDEYNEFTWWRRAI